MPDLKAALPVASRPEVWIEVSRGRTRFRRRPVVGDRLLIGAGSNCQLQLGGDGVPFLHSILLVDDDVTIEAFVPQPELRVNGRPVQSQTLKDGDRIAIGAFEFGVHVEETEGGGDAEDLYAQIPLELADEVEENPGDLSAAELVERIEAAESEVEAFAEGRRNGAAALLDAAWLAGEPAGAETESSEVRLLRELLELSQDLERRVEELRRQEQEHAARAASLLAAQEKLAEQLRLAREISAPNQPLRASA